MRRFFCISRPELRGLNLRILCFSLFLTAACPVLAQVYNLDNNTAPPTSGLGHDYLKELNETVNPGNGSVSLRFDIPLPAARGMKLPFALVYNSTGVERVTGNVNGGGYWVNDSAFGNGGWTTSIPSVSAMQGVNSFYSTFVEPPTTYSCTYISYYIMHDWSGSSHPLGLSLAQSGTYQGSTGCDHVSNQPFTYLSGGDEFVKAVTPGICDSCIPNIPNPVTVADADGTVYSFTSFPGSDGSTVNYGGTPQSSNYAARFGTAYWGPASTIEDRNGNIATISRPSCQTFICQNITDSAGRQVLTMSDTASSASFAVLGQSTPYVASYGNVPVSAFQVATSGETYPCAVGIAPPTFTTNFVVQTLSLPNGQTYSLYYDTTYGLLNKIVYPDGGYIAYTWSLNMASELGLLTGSGLAVGGLCPAYYDSPAIASRTVSYDGVTVAQAQTFSYTTNWQCSTTCTWKTTTVTTTDNVTSAQRKEVYSYLRYSSQSAPNAAVAAETGIPVEQSVAYQDGGGNTLKTVVKGWQSTNLIQCELEQLDSGLISGKWYSYSGGGQITDVKEYDYGVITSSTACGINANAPANPTRETVTSYASFANTPTFSSSASILDRPLTVKIYAGSSSGTLMSETDYAYDGASVASAGSVTGHDETNYSSSYNVRGNLSSKTAKCIGCTNAVTAYTYDSTGQVLSKKDPCGNGACAEMTGSSHTATYSYADSYTKLATGGASNQAYTPSTATNSYLTQITDPLGHTMKFSYDYNSGELTSLTDPNSLQSTYLYNDVFFRPTKANFPDGGSTTYSYNDSPFSAANGTPSVSTTKAITSGTNLTTVTSFDGMRHTVKTQLTSDPDGITTTATAYDGFGQPFTVTNPYRSTNDSTYGSTTMEFDALGRTVEVTEPDGSAMLTSYSGNCVTHSDEAGHLRTTCADSFGRVNLVLEPGTGASTATFGSGTATVSGALQSTKSGGTPGTGRVTILGSEQCLGGGGGGQTPSGCTTYDSGAVTVTVGGFQVQVAYGQPSTNTYIASALSNLLNAGASPVTATVSGGVISIQAKGTGTTTNLALSTSSVSNDPTDFDPPSFTASRSGSTLTGGTNGNGATVYDSGNVTLTVNAVSKTAAYSQTGNSTSALIASALAVAFTSDPNSPADATANGAVITITSREAGAESNYFVSQSTTWNTALFASSSFTTSTPATLTGGASGSTGTAPATTLYSFDVLNNMTCAVQKGTDTTAFTTCAAAPKAWRPRSFIYDSLSRLTSSINPEANTAYSGGTIVATTYSYDVNGNLMSKAFPAQNQTGTATSTISYCYDNANRLTKKQYGSSTTCASPVITYTYDEASCAGGSGSCYNMGHRTSMTDAAGSEHWASDKMGRPLTDQRTTNAITKSSTYTYNYDGSPASVAYPFNGRTVNYTVGAADRLLSASDSSTSYVSLMHYAPQGAMSSMGMGASGTAISMTEIYNNRLQPCWVFGTTSTAFARTHLCSDTESGAGNLLDLQYNLNWSAGDNGNVMGITNNRDTTRSTTYAYDSLNRLMTASTTSTSSTSVGHCWGEAYSMDAMGNMSAMAAMNSSYTGCTIKENAWTASASNQNQLVMSGTSYDSAGNMTATLVGGGTNSYAYNAENQMTSITALSTTSYVYDGDGKRVEKTGGTSQIYWYGADGSVLDETDLSGSTLNGTFSEYIYFGGKRVSRRDSGGNLYYYLTDHLGTTKAMAQVLSGQSTATLCYDADVYPFGGERTYTSICNSNYKFTGKERDGESGLDEFGARYYTSVYGRFTIPDWSAKATDVPYADFGDPQSLNLYAYVRNNPMDRIDPDGHQCDSPGANCSGAKTGEFVGNHGENLKAQQQTANAASSQAGSMKYSINGTTISGGGVTYGKGTNKCNEFACDSVQSGTGYRPQVPKSGILGWLGFTRDPTAKEWATMAIPGYSGPLPLSAARPGDVIAMGHHDDNEGHVGIYVGNGRTASANFYQGGRITVNDWGFRGPGQNGEHPGDAGPVVRQWVGLP